MRFRRLALSVLPLAAVAHGSEVASGVQIVKGAAIADKIERAAPSPGGRGGVIAQDEGYRVHVSERDAPGQAELHEGDTDVWYVMAGGARVARSWMAPSRAPASTGAPRSEAARSSPSPRVT